MAGTLREYEAYIQSIDVKGDGRADSRNESRIKKLAIEYVESEIRSGISADRLKALLSRIKTFLQRQDIERINLKEELKESISRETREGLNKEILVNEARNLIYGSLNIDSDRKKNNPLTNFLKGAVDELVIGNYELAIEIINTNGKVIINSLKKIASWDGLLNIAKSLGENVWDLFAGDAYEKGKSVAQLGLISTGVSLGFVIGKKGLKLGIKQAIKHGLDKEILSPSPRVQAIISKTASRASDVISKEKLTQKEILGTRLEKRVDRLYTLAEATRKDFDGLLKAVGKKSRSSEILDSKKIPLKDKKNVISKAEHSISKGGKLETIKDILRGSIVYDNVSDLKKGLEALKESPKIEKIFINERLDRILNNDILVNVRFKNGFVAEVQLHIRETLLAKQIGYKLDKGIIDLSKIWTKSDMELVQRLKRGEFQGRVLNEGVNLPLNDMPVIGHHMYELRRSIPEHLRSQYGEFIDKTILVESTVFEHARKLYEQRTGMRFNQ